MGLAATQARFLECTARKSNVEYQGQQINEQRTLLANKSSAMYNQMLVLKVPTPPSQTDYTRVVYNTSINGKAVKLSESEVSTIMTAVKALAGDGGTGSASSYKTSADTTITIDGQAYKYASRVNSTDTNFYPNSINEKTGRLSSLYLNQTTAFSDKSDPVKNDDEYNSSIAYFSISEEIDQAAYDDAYNQYKYDQYVYEKEIQDINAQTSVLQQQDKVLELQLKQLDTEQSALKTELEALDKVVGDAVESGYKTFGG